jgi:tetratricopeptide (TPR) repeat protein
VATLEFISIPARFANAFSAYGFYVHKFFVPLQLSAFYPHPGDEWSLLSAGVGVVLILLGSFLSLKWLKDRPEIFVGWFWFVGMLVPVIGIIQVGPHAMADRYMYLPMIGLGILLFFALPNFFANQPPTKPFVFAGVVALFVLLGIQTQKQARTWENTITLFKHALAVNGDHYLLHDYLGIAYLADKQYQAALIEHDRSIEIESRYPNAHQNRGAALLELGEADAAIAALQRALKLDPDHVAAQINLSAALLQAGAIEPAKAAYHRAIEMDPEEPRSHHALALIYAQHGSPGESLQYFQRALQLRHNFPDAHNNFATTLALLGEFEKAEKHYRLAVSQDSDYVMAQVNLASFLARQGRNQEAVQEFQKVLRIAPEHKGATQALAHLKEQRQIRQATGQ